MLNECLLNAYNRNKPFLIKQPQRQALLSDFTSESSKALREVTCSGSPGSVEIQAIPCEFCGALGDRAKYEGPLHGWPHPSIPTADPWPSFQRWSREDWLLHRHRYHARHGRERRRGGHLQLCARAPGSEGQPGADRGESWGTELASLLQPWPRSIVGQRPLAASIL